MILMSSGLKPSLQIESTIISPEDGMPVFIRICPSGFVEEDTDPWFRRNTEGPTILIGSAGAVRGKQHCKSSKSNSAEGARDGELVASYIEVGDRRAKHARHKGDSRSQDRDSGNDDAGEDQGILNRCHLPTRR